MRWCSTLVSSLTLAAGASVSVAQAPTPMGLEVGPSAAVTFTTFSGESTAAFRSRVNFALGVVLQRPFSTTVFAQSGVLYVVRGAGLPGGNLAMSYLEIPVLVGYQLEIAGDTRPYLAAGGHVGLNTSCKVSDPNNSAGCDAFGFDAQTFDVAVDLAIGLSRQVRHGRFGLELRYSLGLLDVEKTSDLKNRSLQIGVSYLVGLRR